MKDGYRYFVSRPTAEDGDPVPVMSSDPSYFRVHDGGSVVYFWSGTEWNRSAIQPLIWHLDDVLGSGATVRELLDEKEIPGGMNV